MADTKGGEAARGVNEMLRITPPLSWVALAGLLLLVLAGLAWAWTGTIPVEVPARGVLVPRGGIERARTPVPGLVNSVKVSLGQTVTEGQTVAVLSGPRPVPAPDSPAPPPGSGGPQGEEVYSAVTGTVLQMLADPGDWLNPGDAVCTIARGETPGLEAWLFVPYRQAPDVDAGSDVYLQVEAISPEESGLLVGKVREVGRFPATQDSLQDAFGSDPRWVDFLLGSQEPMAELWVELVPDKTPTGYRWTVAQGPTRELLAGMLCTGSIEIGSVRPISLAAP